MKLKEVMQGVGVKDWQGGEEGEVSSLAYEAQKVRQGSLFCTWKGKKSDGHAFVREAIERGAMAVVGEQKIKETAGPRIRVENGRRALGRMAANFYGNPSKEVRVFGLTGTNGKTSTAILLQSLWQEGGLRCGYVGTIGNDLGRGRERAKQTTPEALDLQAMLAEMRENGCRAAAIEVSSHALEQGRTEGVHFAGAIFTNLGRDHLDYHGTMAGYEEAKGKLFEGLTEGSFAVVQAEDPAGVRMGARCRPGVRVTTYGVDRGEVRAKNLKMGLGGSSFLLCTPEGEVGASLPWLGRFNVANALAAAAAAMEAGWSAEKVAAGLGRAPAVPGRMEKIPYAGKISVLVDYAHTEEAVGAALSTLQPLTEGSLWVVLGAGGDRDAGKRPGMAAMAGKWADEVILTSDNPRSEDPQKILEEMQAGLPRGKAVQVWPNRAEAIRVAVRSAKAGDVILVAGKGHEEFQEIQGERIPFSDRREVERALAERSQE